MLKFDLEAQSVIERTVASISFWLALNAWDRSWWENIGVGSVGCSRLLFLTGGLVVRDIETVTVPADLLGFGLLGTVDERLHTLVIVAVRFHQVDNVEAVSAVGPRIAYPEEIPLSVAVSAIVILKVQIVLTVRNFDCTSQVSRFKSRLKNEGLICRWFQFVIWRQVIVVPVDSGTFPFL